MYFGMAKSEIEKVARIGESYEDTAVRINKSKESAKINNLEHFADLRKRLGDKAIKSIPDDIANILKAQGRW